MREVSGLKRRLKENAAVSDCVPGADFSGPSCVEHTFEDRINVLGMVADVEFFFNFRRT